MATTRFTWTTALNNYEPPRAHAHGIGDVSSDGAITLHSSDFPFTAKTVFLLDDGATVRPCYVAGMRPGGGTVRIRPFPLLVGWQLGPARAYHLKVTYEQPLTCPRCASVNRNDRPSVLIDNDVQPCTDAWHDAA